MCTLFISMAYVETLRQVATSHALTPPLTCQDNPMKYVMTLLQYANMHATSLAQRAIVSRHLVATPKPMLEPCKTKALVPA